MGTDTVTLTFLFNMAMIVIFSITYSQISPHNFKALNPSDELTFLDFLFYAVTIQSGIGLPDVTALSDLAKALALCQQLSVIGSAYILLRLFFKNK